MESRHSTINFDEPVSFNVASRDYGLIRISQRSTPFPCVQKSLSASKIAQRLGVEALQNISESSSTSETKTSMCPFKKKGSSTPHPIKGIELNPKVLVKNMLTNKAKRFLTNFDGASLKSFSTNTGIFTNDFHQGFVSPPGLEPTEKKGSFRNKGSQSRDSKKKVSWFVPQKSLHFVTSEHDLLSFKERRRLFNMAEYTIAKNGKKMSEVAMAAQPQPDTSMDHMDKADWQAHVEIASYINNHGFTIDDSDHTAHIFRKSSIHKIKDSNKSTSNLIPIKQIK